MHRDQRPPIVTLTSDFGTRDAYVAAMKAAVLRQCPEATLVDVTHEIPRHDVTAGSIVLERAWHAFRDLGRAVHLCVVDPGVGSEREILVARVGKAVIICPDNGLMTWLARRWPGERRMMWRVTEIPAGASSVFHGRDVMAPLAGKLADGAEMETLPLEEMRDVVRLDVHPAQAEGRAEAGSLCYKGRVIHIDHFGNCTTNVVADGLGEPASWRARVAGRDLGPLRRTYGDVAPGEPLALVGSSDLVEIAVREGSAAQAMGIAPGTPVELERLR